MRFDDARDDGAGGRGVGRAVDGVDERGCIEDRSTVGHPGSVAYPADMPRLRVAAAQLNLVVGDIEGNAARILEVYDRAEAAGCDLVAFPELAVTGYPPEDLLLRPSFVASANEMVEKLAARTGRAAAVIGFPEIGHDLFNSAAVCAAGAVQGVYRKHLLPELRGVRRAALLRAVHRRRPAVRHRRCAGGGVDLRRRLEPERPDHHAGRGRCRVRREHQRVAVLRRTAARARDDARDTRAADASVPVLYVNLVGGQDELVFDGASMLFDAGGNLVARAKQFDEDLLDRRHRRASRVPASAARSSWARAGRGAPGGADQRGPHRRSSAGAARRGDARAGARGLRGARARHARLRAEERRRPTCSSRSPAVSTRRSSPPSRPTRSGPSTSSACSCRRAYSSEGSITDAEALAANLGIRTLTVPIERAHAAFLDLLAEPFEHADPGLAGENLQARIRGTILMALSNKLGGLVLTAGNKSEMATGYATLYGADMTGAFAVIKDVPKMLVYALARDRNERAGRALIPDAVLEKPPSAELRPDQKDSDSLARLRAARPDHRGLRRRRSLGRRARGAGHDPDTVRRVTRLIDRNEYKRRQAPPGVRVSPKAFGKDRRLPITNRWPG